jgi:hypothetical protein
VNVVIGPPIPAPGPADAGRLEQTGETPDPATSRRRARVGREATTEHSLRVRAAIQQAFDAAEARLRR